MDIALREVRILTFFQGKILRQLLGTIREDEEFRHRHCRELYEIYRELDAGPD